MAGVAVVTDSTASLTADRAAGAGVHVIPLQVVIDGASRPEGPAMGAAEVARALRAGAAVSTSRPGPEAFASTYAELAEQGASGVVSVHLSAGLSGTYDAAVRAAATAPVEVVAVDSRTLAMAQGFAALAGAECSAAGGSLSEVEAEVRRRAAGATTYFYVDSLEYLRRGGRIGAAQALLGAALAVKPLLTIAEGTVAPYERVRTRAKALTRLTELVAAAVGSRVEGRRVDVAVHHLDDAAGAQELLDRLRDRAGWLGDVTVAELSPVLGVHTGPGTLGVVVSPR